MKTKWVSTRLLLCLCLLIIPLQAKDSGRYFPTFITQTVLPILQKKERDSFQALLWHCSPAIEMKGKGGFRTSWFQILDGQPEFAWRFSLFWMKSFQMATDGEPKVHIQTETNRVLYSFGSFDEELGPLHQTAEMSFIFLEESSAWKCTDLLITKTH